MHNRNKNLLLYLCCLFSLSILLCSCGRPDDTQTITAEENQNRLYIYAVNGQWSVLNTEGEFIIPPQPNELQLICDRYTNEPRYIHMTKPIAGEKIPYTIGDSDKVYHYYENNRFLYDIYDARGNLLYENLENTYCNTMGDFLILTKEGEALITIVNRKTGEETTTDADWVSFCGNLFVFNWEDEPCARVYDQDMQFLKEIPGYVFHYSREQDGKRYLVMIGENDRMALFDNDFNLLLPAEYAYFEQINGDFVLARNANHQSVVMNLDTGEIVLPPEKNRDIYYCDGEMVLYVLYDEAGQRTFQLVNLKDESKTWTAPNIQTIRLIRNYEQEDTTLGFYIEAANSEAMIVNTQGEVILDLPAQSWVEDVSENVIAIKHNRMENRPVKLYTRNGKEIPLEKNYYQIRTLWHQGPLPYLAAYYETPQGANHIDLLDENGRILIENLWENITLENDDILPFFCDGYRVLGRRGFSQGMMDIQGNWIYKESVFDSFANDY
ncbi:MAG: DUF5046 domain-containing protein [Peptococcaceae bacterium]|jgi:hypothetical protein|nr:DUF5046 domain-containing protein [Peptococcaceae bacterium]